IIREVFVKILWILSEAKHQVSFVRILRLREVARVTARIALEFALEFVYVYRLDFVECYLILLVMHFSVSLLLTPLCCDDIHDITPRVSALAGCDRLSRREDDPEGSYETSEEEPVEQPRRHDLYGFVDHPQLQQGNLMNEFAPHRLPQPKGNMNGWLIENEEKFRGMKWTRTLSPPQVVNLCGRRQLKMIMTVHLETAMVF
ncbi:hypothetical protein Tco_0085454, partial [Tanacetum coccineum]